MLLKLNMQIMHLSLIHISVIEVEANRVAQVKDLANDGYRAIQVTTGAKKANRVTKPLSLIHI